MPRLASLTDRLLALVGLDFDLDLAGDAVSPITGALFVGARPTTADVASLQQLGITHVVSCLEAEERAEMAFLAGPFEHSFLPLRDGIDQDIASFFPAFFDVVRSSGPGKVLVHCRVGVSRSATLAIAQLMASRRVGFLEAYRGVRSQRPGVLPNIGFASQLQRFERELSLPTAPGEPSSLARYLRRHCQVPLPLDVLDDVLAQHDEDAPSALRAVFGDEIPRVVQGVRR